MNRASSASAIKLSCDEFGQQYRSLQEAAAARRSDLESIFSAYGMIYPFLPVDRELTELPLTFTSPFFSVHEKLYHQVERISKYFRNCAQQREGAFRLDRLGELAYQDGRCDFYHQHASTLLEALRAVDLLKVVTANAAGNFVLTIDEASTSLPRQTLDEIMDNMMQNSYVLIDDRFSHTDEHSVMGVYQVHAAQCGDYHDRDAAHQDDHSLTPSLSVRL